jgi:hypothetical protein
MKKYFLIILFMLVEVAGVMLFKPAILADGALSKQLSLSQVRITGDEYVVLRNTTNSNLQLNNYWLQYFNEFSLSTVGVSSSSTQLPSVTLQPNQEILLSSGVAANCGQIWVSKLPFSLKDSGGLLQVVALSQASGIVGYKPEDQVAWSSKTTDPVDIKGVSSSSSSPIWYMSDSKWSASATPQGCSVAGTTGGSTPQALNLTHSSTSPPSLFLDQSTEEDIPASGIPAADAGLNAPQLSEIMPNPGSPKTDVNDEYIELYNPNDKPFDLSGFKLKAGTSSTTSFTFDIVQNLLQPHEFKAFYSSQTNVSLSNATSKVWFISPNDDVLAESDIYSDAKDNYTWVYADGLWQWTSTATPNARNIIPSNTTTSQTLGASTSRPPASTLSKKYAALQISELLPHPQKPLTDAEGEYIEIYNPNKQPVNLAGYIIVSGINDDHKYTIKSGTISAKSYKAFYRPESKLTLSNTQSRAKILAPDGSELDVTANYSKVIAGLSWIYASGKWQWTSTPTPGKANIVTLPAALGSKTAKGSSIASSSSSPNPYTSPNKSIIKAPLHPAVLAGVGAAALLYALYEYRHDLGNLFYKLRRNRETRRVIG